MLRRRFIPKILVHHSKGRLLSVISKKFDNFIVVGSPKSQFKIMDSNKADEIAIVRVGKSNDFSIDNFANLIADLLELSSTPVSVGGQIRTVEEAATIMKTGVEKIILPIRLNATNTNLVKFIADRNGSQSVLVSLDYKYDGKKFQISQSNEWIDSAMVLKVVDKYIGFGAGEIALTNIDCDGSKNGFDNSLLNFFVTNLKVPVIISGGVNSPENFIEAFSQGADGVMSGTYFAKMDHSLLQLRSKVALMGINVRNFD